MQYVFVMTHPIFIPLMEKLEDGISSLFKNRWFSHLFFWVSFILFHGILWGSYDEEYGSAFIIQSIFLPIKILVSYFSIYVLLPKYILKGKWLQFVLLLVISAFSAGVLHRLTAYYIEYPLYFPEYIDGRVFNLFKILKGVASTYPVVFLALAIKLLKYWYVNQQDKQILAHEKLDAELKFLKTQIHPHFLFNTLNNLYALTLKKSDYAPEVVLKLSELINYMLYECNVPKVLLDNELNFIKNYIEIERIRHSDEFKIKAVTNGDTANIYIAPMLLIPFLENSFKHGVNGAVENSWIDFDLTIEGNMLLMRIENSIGEAQELHDIPHHGIGLKNVKRRLDLLYPEDYELNIQEYKDTFVVVLKLVVKKEIQ